MKSSPKKQQTKARVCLCLKLKGRLLKFAWVNEDAIGVYVGVYGTNAGMHFSYHVDGKTHFKGPKKQLLFPPTDKRPIEAISETEQLTIMAVPLQYEEAIGKTADAFGGDGNGIVVFISVAEEIESATLNVSEYIIHRSAEATFADRLIKAFSGLPTSKLVGFVTVPLVNFPAHKVALVVSARLNAPS